MLVTIVRNMVRSSMMKLNNKELVEQIEDKVGNDLQYIRLNGAVVGGSLVCTCFIEIAKLEAKTSHKRDH
jgi:uncharacterized membrane-anchored protein YjiN (DUF445 family)